MLLFTVSELLRYVFSLRCGLLLWLAPVLLLLEEELLKPLLCVPSEAVPCGLTTGLLWFEGLDTVALLPEVVPPYDGLAVLPEAGLATLPVRPPGAVLVTAAFLSEAGLEVTVAGFFDAAVCLSRIAGDVLVMLLFPPEGLDVTAEADDDVLRFIGRLLTELPPLRELVLENIRSEPVLWRVPV